MIIYLIFSEVFSVSEIVLASKYREHSERDIVNAGRDISSHNCHMEKLVLKVLHLLVPKLSWNFKNIY